MTQVTTAEASAGRGSPTERLVARVEFEIKDRLGLQASLEGRVPAVLVNRILGEGLMTYEQIAEATRQRGTGEKGNGNGSAH